MSENNNWDDLPVIDAGVIGPLCEVLEESAIDVFNEFLEDTPRIANEIRTAMNKGKFIAIAELVHQLKSSSGSLGGIKVQKLCSWVEKLTNGGDEQEIRHNCSLLFSAIDELLPEIKKYRDSIHG